MEAKKVVDLMDKLIDRKLKKFYVDVIKPDIEKMIKDAMPVKEDLISNNVSDIDEDLIESVPSGLMDAMELDEVVKKRPLLPTNKKETKKFNIGNKALNSILNEMASNPSKYRVAGENDMSAYSALMSGQYAGSTEEWPEMQYDIVPGKGIITPKLPEEISSDDAQRSLDSVKKEVYLQTGGNADIANALVKDYRTILKKADEKAKTVRGGV